MKMLLADGKKTVECASDPSIDPYEMQMSKGVNQSIWQLCGKPHDAKKQDLVLRLMAAGRGEAVPHGEDEFVILRVMQLAYHMEWILGMLAGPDTHHVLLEDPKAVLASFKALCLDLADIEQGPAAETLKRGMARAGQRCKEVENGFLAQQNHQIGAPKSPFSYGYGQPISTPAGGGWGVNGFGPAPGSGDGKK